MKPAKLMPELKGDRLKKIVEFMLSELAYMQEEEFLRWILVMIAERTFGQMGGGAPSACASQVGTCPFARLPDGVAEADLSIDRSEAYWHCGLQENELIWGEKPTCKTEMWIARLISGEPSAAQEVLE